MCFNGGTVPGRVSSSLSASREVMGFISPGTREDVVRDRKGEAQIWESNTTVGGGGGDSVLELVGLLFEGVLPACLTWFCVESGTCGVPDASVICSDDIASERPVFPPN